MRSALIEADEFPGNGTFLQKLLYSGIYICHARLLAPAFFVIVTSRTDAIAAANMLLDITATNEEGDVHHVTFAGPVGFEDIRD